MKILDLPLKAKWYEMIESGEKKEEYREIKPYWAKRFLKDYPIFWRAAMSIAIELNDFHVFYGRHLHLVYTHVRFRYGYTKRTMLFELKEMVVGKGNPACGAPSYDVFILKLGKRCNITNIE